MVELLTAPPDRRESILDERVGGPAWRPGRALTIADLDALWFSEDDLRRDPESGETTGAHGDCAVHLRKRLSVGLRRIEAPVLVG
jgi:hypothetical protein